MSVVPALRETLTTVLCVVRPLRKEVVQHFRHLAVVGTPDWWSTPPLQSKRCLPTTKNNPPMRTRLNPRREKILGQAVPLLDKKIYSRRAYDVDCCGSEPRWRAIPLVWGSRVLD